MNPLYDLLTWTYVETLFSLWNDLNSQYNYSSGSCKNHLLPPDSIRIFVVKEAGVFCVFCLSAFMQTLNFEKEERAAETGSSWGHSVPDGSGSPPSGPPVTSVIPSWIQSVCQPIDQPAHTERWDAGVSGLRLPHLCVCELSPEHCLQ